MLKDIYEAGLLRALMSGMQRIQWKMDEGLMETRNTRAIDALEIWEEIAK